MMNENTPNGSVVTLKGVKFHIPGTMCCYGPTCSGKTTWLCRLLKDIENHFYTSDGSTPKRIVYCHNSVHQPMFDVLKEKGVEFKIGMPDDIQSLFPPTKRPGILILDDLMGAVNKNDKALEAVTVTAHHSSIFLIVTQQCLHPRGKNAVQLRQNFHYKVLFPYPGDQQNIKRFLSNNETGEKLKQLHEYYLRCCEHEDYDRYLLIAAHPLEDNRLIKYRTSVLNGEKQTRILVDKRHLENVKLHRDKKRKIH